MMEKRWRPPLLHPAPFVATLSMSSSPVLVTSFAAHHPRDDITAVITQLSLRPGPDDGRCVDDDEDRRGRRATTAMMMVTIPHSRYIVCLPPPLSPQFPCSDRCRCAFRRPLLSCCLTASATASPPPRCRDITMQSSRDADVDVDVGITAIASPTLSGAALPRPFPCCSRRLPPPLLFLLLSPMSSSPRRRHLRVIVIIAATPNPHHCGADATK